MTRFIYRPKQLAEIAQQIVVKSAKPLVAVAFWGEGIIEHLGLSLLNGQKFNFDELKIVLRLAPGTNASVVREIRKTAKAVSDTGPRILLKQCGRLHAKVWIGDDTALVSSANASVYGLGFNSTVDNYWNEAGIIVEDPNVLNEMRQWFEKLWSDHNECQDIKDVDIITATSIGPPAPPRSRKKVTNLSDIMRTDVCPIMITQFCGETSRASDNLAKRKINALKTRVFNAKRLKGLNHFELYEWQPVGDYKPEQYYVGAHITVDEGEKKRAWDEGNVKSVSKIDTYYH
jgi:hypothetical protein